MSSLFGVPFYSLESFPGLIQVAALIYALCTAFGTERLRVVLLKNAHLVLLAPWIMTVAKAASFSSFAIMEL